MTRILWLTFALIVVLIVFVPELLHAEAPEAKIALCGEGGLCLIKESVLDDLISRSGKAGKDCT
jgi:hypothetical protein